MRLQSSSGNFKAELLGAEEPQLEAVAAAAGRQRLPHLHLSDQPAADCAALGRAEELRQAANQDSRGRMDVESR